MSTHVSNQKLISGLYVNPLSIIDLSTFASYVCDSNQVQLNQLTLVTDFLRLKEPENPDHEYQRRLSNAQSAFKTLQNVLKEAFDKTEKVCAEAEIATRIVIQSYYYRPKLGQPEEMNEFIFVANRKGLFDEQKN